MEDGQWRFQWPDGTWIRWNPRTQTWEKEPPQESSNGATVAPEAEAPLEPEPEYLEGPAAEAVPEPEQEYLEEPAAEAVPEPERSGSDDFDEWDAELEEDRPVAPRGRLGVAEVLPPGSDEPRVKGRVLPWVAGGSVVGIAIGLALSILIG